MILIATLAGILLIGLILWDVFVAMVLTRRATRQLQLTTFLVIGLHRIYFTLARLTHDQTRRENYLSLAGPLILFLRFGIWAFGLIVAFALLQWAAGSQILSPQERGSFSTMLYFSGTTFFTVGLGDATPQTPLPAVLNVIEAATGFGFLGLIISYLPVFYQDYSQRETHLALLDEWAGSPPSAGELLRRLGEDHALDELNPFLKEWEDWAAELLESHLSYPVLALFRSQHENESWVSALAMILDLCALVLVGIKGVQPHAARLTFAMARHAAVDLSQSLAASPIDPPTDRLPPADWVRLRAILHSAGIELGDEPDVENKLKELRNLYEAYVNALAETLLMPLPEWLPHADARDNWQRTARSRSNLHE